jgi:hypothetical protein
VYDLMLKAFLCGVVLTASILVVSALLPHLSASARTRRARAARPQTQEGTHTGLAARRSMSGLTLPRLLSRESLGGEGEYEVVGGDASMSDAEMVSLDDLALLSPAGIGTATTDEDFIVIKRRQSRASSQAQQQAEGAADAVDAGKAHQ